MPHIGLASSFAWTGDVDTYVTPFIDAQIEFCVCFYPCNWKGVCPRGTELSLHDVNSIYLWTVFVFYAEMSSRFRFTHKKDRARKKRVARAQKKVCS